MNGNAITQSSINIIIYKELPNNIRFKYLKTFSITIRLTFLTGIKKLNFHLILTIKRCRKIKEIKILKRANLALFVKTKYFDFIERKDDMDEL
mgnify:CR=1 FL=1